MSPSPDAPAPFTDLVEESLDEASFLWRRWESELSSLTRNLDDVWSWTEDRLHGALDGVRIAGATSPAIVSGLQSDDTDRVAASTGALASSDDPAAADAIAAALREAEGDRLRAMLRGLELLGSKNALRVAAKTLAGRGPTGAAAVCRLKAFRRAAPAGELTKAFKSDSLDARVEAVRAAVHVPGRQADDVLVAALRSEERAVCLAAVETGVAIGMRRAWDAAKTGAQQRDPDGGPYLRLLAMLGRPADHDTIYEALRIPTLQMDAVWALGHIGTARAVESCLAGMKHDALARACGEAYCWITGADLVRDGLDVPETPPDAPPFEEDDLDADLVPRPEDLWPRPDPDAVSRDWAARQTRFAPDERFVRGRPRTRHALLETIEAGPMLRRADLVFELRTRTKRKYDVETRAFASRQRQMMAESRAAVGTRET